MAKIEFEKLAPEEYLSFYSSLRDARLVNGHGYYVDLADPDVYKTTDNFLISGGVGGFAIENGNLVAVHKNPLRAKEASVGRIMHSLMFVALENGATKLDCYGDFLGETYMQYGFLPVGKMEFNREYNPSWPYEEEPKVFVMFRAVSSIDELVLLQEKNALLHLDEVEDDLPTFIDYDELLGERDKILERVQKGNYTYSQILKMLREGGLESE